MTVQQSFQINRETWIWGVLFAQSIFVGFTGIVFVLLPSRRAWGVCCLLQALILFFLSYWAEKTPYMRVTSDEIQIFRFPFFPMKCISWTQIHAIHRKKKTVELILEGHKKIRINCGKRTERERFVEIVEEKFLTHQKSTERPALCK